jgi:hypothetical protein
MKILLRYEPEDDEEDELETSFALTLPKAWLAGPIEKLHKFAVDQFNKKHPSAEISKEDSHLELKGVLIANDTIVSESGLKEGSDVYLKRGLNVVAKRAVVVENEAATTTTSSNRPPGSVPCKRFGCNKYFLPGANAEKCLHHKKPPVFHETRKYWACCPDKIGWDWESFQAIPGCEESETHTNEAVAKQRVMGGTELRAEINGPAEIPKAKTGLDKLMQLRQDLVEIGVRGEVFDLKRDQVKRLHEGDDTPQVWDKVCQEMAQLFQQALSS